MTWFSVWIVVLVVSLGGLWLAELPDLRKAHARRRVAVLNAVRLAAAAALLVVLVWVVNPRTLAGAAVGAICAALVLTPVGWVVRVGGIEPEWELRRLILTAGDLSRRYESPRPPKAIAEMRRLVSQMYARRTPATSELVALRAVDLEDWINGTYRPIDLGRRSIRIYEIERELYGTAAGKPENAPDDATFLWQLYRAFGEMIDWGSAEPSEEQRATFERLTEALSRYRRSDTSSFIDATQESARAWLSSGWSNATWPPAGGIPDLGPAVESAFRALWPTVKVFWGAELSEDDRRELAIPDSSK
jgi:hypothetical protein